MTPSEYRSIRKKIGLTQTGLAALLHETRDTVSRRERSHKPIKGSAEYALLWLMEHGEAEAMEDHASEEAGATGDQPLALHSAICSVGDVVRIIQGEPEYPDICRKLLGYIKDAVANGDEEWVLHMVRQAVRQTKEQIIAKLSSNSVIRCHSDDSTKTHKQPK